MKLQFEFLALEDWFFKNLIITFLLHLIGLFINTFCIVSKNLLF